MNRESHTPRTDALMPDQGQKRTMLEHIEAMETHARQLELELNAAIKELTHLANLIDAHFENGGTIAGLGTTNKAIQIIEKSKL